MSNERAKTLVSFRKSKRWTRKKAAQMYGVHINTLTNWEHGKTPVPSWMALVLAALAYGLPPFPCIEHEEGR